MALKTFIAMDFETMTAERTSACAVGLVKVVNGVITKKFYSLINPIPDKCTSTNTRIHGITPEMVVDAPTFDQLFPSLLDFIGSLPLVCHNAAFDIDVLKRCMEHFGLKGINTSLHLCTYEFTNLSLDKACGKYSIELSKHHDSLEDAVACAKIYLALNEVECKEASPQKYACEIPSKEKLAARKYERTTLVKLDDECVEDKSTPFYGAKVVITGTFEQFPNRNKIGRALQSLGADINTAISKKTNIVVVGDGAGPSKLAKIEDLQAEGYDIEVYDEIDLETYIGDIYDNI